MENGRRELFVQNFNQKLSLLMACIPSLVSDEAFYVGMSFVRLEESVSSSSTCEWRQDAASSHRGIPEIPQDGWHEQLFEHICRRHPHQS